MTEDLGLADVPTKTLLYWLGNCRRFMERENGAARTARERQIGLLELELRRRGALVTTGVGPSLRETT